MQAQADGPRPVLVSAAGPVALLGLLRGQVLKAAIVHLADVARDDLAELRAGQLGLRPWTRDEQPAAIRNRARRQCRPLRTSSTCASWPPAESSHTRSSPL